MLEGVLRLVLPDGFETWRVRGVPRVAANHDAAETEWVYSAIMKYLSSVRSSLH